MSTVLFLKVAALFLLLSLPLPALGQSHQFVTTSGPSFVLNNGKPFRFAGTNNYYLSYQDRYMVEDVFRRAAQHNFTVIRTWAFLDVGYTDGSASVGGGPKNGVWFQGMDNTTLRIVYSDAGLQHLDYVLLLAAQYKIRLILALTNNWADFGGVDQYVRWELQANASYTDAHHDDFFIREYQISAYLAYASMLVNRKNSITGLAYKDDPAIFAWELMNEPRCQGSGAYPSTNNCTLNYAKYKVPPVAFKITPWVDRVSTAIKAMDSNHLLAVGDEGFLCLEYQQCPDQSCDCYVGTDFQAFTALPNIDFGSMHLYPESWGKASNALEWGVEWVANHTSIAHGLGKPVLLGEFGIKAGQSDAYAAWGKAIVQGKTDGDLFWMLCGAQDYHNSNSGAPWYPNYDGFCVYCPNATEPSAPGDSQSCRVLTDHANEMANAP
jgi:mannan endo-1,4-beta-mannosidase